jgi:alpha-L-fucosidase
MKRPYEKRIADYIEAVDNFDVVGFTDQIIASGARFLIFTLAHADMVLPFPLPALDEIVPGHTARRDLIGEISDILTEKGIRLILYFNPDGPCDSDWRQAVRFADDVHFHAEQVYRVVGAISEKYGERISGWWIDDCYDTHVLTEANRGRGHRYDYKRLGEALRRGNPDAILAFNFSGAVCEWKSELGRGVADYQAGEENWLHRSPSERFCGEGGTQWFGFSWMDDFWVHDKPGVPTPRFSDAEVLAYVTRVKSMGGAFAYGAAAYKEGLISEPTMKQLLWLSENGI